MSDADLSDNAVLGTVVAGMGDADGKTIGVGNTITSRLMAVWAITGVTKTSDSLVCELGVLAQAQSESNETATQTM